MGSTRRSLFAVIAVLGLANVVVTVDFYGTNTALPSIIADLDIGTDADQWISLAYLVMLAAPLVAAGRWADRVGRRRVLMVGLAVLAVGQVTSAAAQGEVVLFLGRAVAGLGGALVTATGLALVSASAPVGRRAGAIGAWSAIGAIGAALGPLIGGVVTQFLSWRWLFLLAAPVAFVVGIAALVVVPESRDEDALPSADLGAALITVGLALAVFGGTRGPIVGWLEPAVVLTVVGGIGCIVGFVVVDRRAAAPLVPVAVVKNRVFVLAGSIAFLSNAAFASVMFFMTLYLQQVYGLGPIMTGVVFLAMTVPLMGFSPFLGRLVRRLGQAGVLAVGMGVLVVAFVVLGMIDASSGLVLAVAGLALSGIGQAFAFNGSNVAALSDVRSDDVGVASGAVNGIRQLGAVVGLAVTGALFDAVQRGEVATLGATRSFTMALRPTMFFLAAVCLVGALLSAGARRRGKRR